MKQHKTRNGVAIVLEDGDLPDEAYTHKLKVGERTAGYGRSKVTIEVAEAAVSSLGEHGRLLAESKRTYSKSHPDHEVYFNACIFDAHGTEIWFGDLDLTLDGRRLERLGGLVGTVYVTPEHPYRFDGLPNDREVDQAILRFG